MRDIISLACLECKRRNYSTTKNRKKSSERLELSKYCRFCRKHTAHFRGEGLLARVVPLAPAKQVEMELNVPARAARGRIGGEPAGEAGEVELGHRRREDHVALF